MRLLTESSDKNIDVDGDFYICSFCLKPFYNKVNKTSVSVLFLGTGGIHFEKVSSNSLD